MPEPVRVSIRAAGRLNPSESGESLATTVRLYQLKDVSKLQAASLEHFSTTIGRCWATTWSRSRKSRSTPMKGHPGNRPTRGGPVFRCGRVFSPSAGAQWRVASKLAPPDAQYCHAPGGGDARSALRFKLVDGRVELH